MSIIGTSYARPSAMLLSKYLFEGALFAGKSTLNSLHMRPLARRCATFASGPKRLAIVGLHLSPGPIPNRLATSTTRIAHCTAIRTKDRVTAICCSPLRAKLLLPPSVPAPARSRIVRQIREACPTCAMASSAGSHAEGWSLSGRWSFAGGHATSRHNYLPYTPSGVSHDRSWPSSPVVPCKWPNVARLLWSMKRNWTRRRRLVGKAE